MNIRIFLEEEPFLQNSLEQIRISVSAEQPEYHIALSGGTTPAALYKALANEAGLPWEKITLWQVDERCVPRTSNDSNYHLVEETLLMNLIRPRAFNAFNPELPPEQAAEEYEKLLQTKKEPFDLIILGIGNDGHTASLFPHSPALAEKDRLALHTVAEHYPNRERLTLTFPPIMESKRLLVLLKGHIKAPILDKLTATETTIQQFPSKKLTEHPALTVFFLNA